MAEGRRFPEGIAQDDEDADNRAPMPSYPHLPSPLSDASLRMLQKSLCSTPNTSAVLVADVTSRRTPPLQTCIISRPNTWAVMGADATPRPTTPLQAYLPSRAIPERTLAFLGSQPASRPMPPLENTDFIRMQKDLQIRLTTLAGLVADAQELLQPSFGRTASQPPANWHNELCDRTLNKLGVTSSILSEASNEMRELYSAPPEPELDVDWVPDRSEAGWSTKCHAPDHMDLSGDEKRDCPSPRAVLASQQAERRLALETAQWSCPFTTCPYYPGQCHCVDEEYSGM
ncbi:hypothetical protein GE09DRAFT_277118 [Coniochaeta sp. 2T2.1]|nr:hypothetical protein GE09DRAFT_277118 [Coniochaeta sp. 2T2.1]